MKNQNRMAFQHFLFLLFSFACSFSNNTSQTFSQCLAHYEKQELENAAGCFEKIRSDKNYSLRAMIMLARVRYFENKFDEAKTLLEEIIDDEPFHTEARYWLARTLAVIPLEDGANEREQIAIEQLKKVLEINPHHIHARSLLALLYEKRNMYREALYEYLAALQEEETLMAARANLSILYRRIGLIERALSEIDRAIAISRAANMPIKNLLAIKKELLEK
ncbi:MAG: tetratricopeptide repeat protein [Spirochaetes bacterium]|nr:tetratricopeptide repeat protein [Spirochaetota bacterium]